MKRLAHPQYGHSLAQYRGMYIQYIVQVIVIFKLGRQLNGQTQGIVCVLGINECTVTVADSLFYRNYVHLLVHVVFYYPTCHQRVHLLLISSNKMTITIAAFVI